MSPLWRMQFLAEVFKLHKEEKEASTPSIRKDAADTTPTPAVTSTSNVPNDNDDIIVLDNKMWR